MSDPLVVFLHSSRYDRVYQAANLVLTASSMGQKSYLFLFYDALATFVAGEWDDTESIAAGKTAPPEWAVRMQRSFDLAGSPSLYDVLEMARKETGGLTVCACTTSARMLELEPAAITQRGVDEMVGLVTMLDIARSAHPVLYL